MTPTATRSSCISATRPEHERVAAIAVGRRLRKAAAALPARGPAGPQHLRTSEQDQVLGVRMGAVFALAKEHIAMEPDQIEALLECPIHEARIGAVSVMDFQARRKRTPEARRTALFELYLRRHDRIDGWDLVDRAAPHVVGGHLLDKPRDPLYTLARSSNQWERRTAIVATYAFIRQGEVDDTFAIGEILAEDSHHFAQTAVGGWVREAGKRDRPRLLAFIDAHAARMPRTALSFAIEQLSAEEKAHYRSLTADG